MLEFNNKHKKVNLEYIKWKCKNLDDKTLNVVWGFAVVGSLSTLYVVLCKTFVFADIPEEYNKAMISIDDEYVVVNINKTWNYDNIFASLRLEDGTKIIASSKDVNLYKDNSVIIENMEDSISPIYINIDNVDSYIKDDNLDRALVHYNGDELVLDISHYHEKDGNLSLELTDGTLLTVNLEGSILFNSQSPVMNQVQEEVLGETRSLKR